MSTETVLSSASSAAAALIDGRILPDTKKMYKQRLTIIKQFYSEHLQLEFSIPVTAQHIINFFGWLIEVKHKDKPVSVPSSSSSNARESFRVFDGDNNGSRFSDVLHRVIKTLPASEVQVLGGTAKVLGTHSVPKGAATYCTGMINGPAPVQVFLRAGWSLGVQDRTCSSVQVEIKV